MKCFQFGIYVATYANSKQVYTYSMRESRYFVRLVKPVPSTIIELYASNAYPITERSGQAEVSSSIGPEMCKLTYTSVRF